jgi:hypothetical protein
MDKWKVCRASFYIVVVVEDEEVGC